MDIFIRKLGILFCVCVCVCVCYSGQKMLVCKLSAVNIFVVNSSVAAENFIW